MTVYKGYVHYFSHIGQLSSLSWTFYVYEMYLCHFRTVLKRKLVVDDNCLAPLTCNIAICFSDLSFDTYESSLQLDGIDTYLKRKEKRVRISKGNVTKLIRFSTVIFMARRVAPQSTCLLTVFCLTMFKK